MRGIIMLIARIIQAWQRVYARKWNFLGVFAFVFIGSATILGQLGLLPSIKSDLVLGLPEITSATAAKEVSPAANRPMIVESPVKIEIPKVNLSTIVVNPTTTDVVALDKELLKGAVRYPTSARLDETGNVVLFGHSSYLPVVGNKAYKAFNEIQKLIAGDVVTVYSSDTAYTYEVKNVAKEKANNNTAIPLSVAGKILTLVTCNSFGAKEDRFVVTAELVESHSISI